MSTYAEHMAEHWRLRYENLLDAATHEAEAHLLALHFGRELSEHCDELEGAIFESLSELSAAIGTCDCVTGLEECELCCEEDHDD